MLAKTMLSRVETCYQTLRAENEFYLRIQAGNVGPDDVACFVKNIAFLVAHTPAHLVLAADSSERRGLVRLADFFRSKLGEEQGHDEWGHRDLGRMDAQFGVTPTDLPILASMQAIVELNEATIAEDPLSYLAHIVLAEYLTVIATPQLAAELAGKCGIPAEMLSIFTNHAELDVEHVDEWTRVLPNLVTTTSEGQALLDALERSIAHYGRFCQEVGRRERA